MRITTFLFFLCLTCLHLNAQNIHQLVAEDACECIENKSPEEINNTSAEMLVGLCVLEGVMNHKTEFETYFNGKGFREIDMEKFGEDVGIEMVTICPSTFLLFFSNEVEDKMYDDLKIELGKIISIEKNQFNTVNLELGDGSILKFLWLWDFEGSQMLLDGSYKNKWMNIIYSNIEMFDPHKNTYVVYKIIEGMELGE